ncbi:hypothetical protein M2405_002723 [Rhodococcus erythropolis]|nr:hypothetical protein N601_08185 [Rhodococcus erythropolis DN1]MCS4254445.1 hypothetical protein [Rhodococcus erythropolis]MCW2429575.1 hypothetical protein [Rhodococcus erythropolis]
MARFPLGEWAIRLSGGFPGAFGAFRAKGSSCVEYG